ncbi:hypothetical protein HK102_004733 [Quaeritorhiza haematococci]|nr:hypothetical protein HK102_004733 [Quaeritorhiza haematococci]
MKKDITLLSPASAEYDNAQENQRPERSTSNEPLPRYSVAASTPMVEVSSSVATPTSGASQVTVPSAAHIEVDATIESGGLTYEAFQRPPTTSDGLSDVRTSISYPRCSLDWNITRAAAARAAAADADASARALSEAHRIRASIADALARKDSAKTTTTTSSKPYNTVKALKSMDGKPDSSKLFLKLAERRQKRRKRLIMYIVFFSGLALILLGLGVWFTTGAYQQHANSSRLSSNNTPSPSPTTSKEKSSNTTGELRGAGPAVINGTVQGFNALAPNVTAPTSSSTAPSPTATESQSPSTSPSPAARVRYTAAELSQGLRVSIARPNSDDYAIFGAAGDLLTVARQVNQPDYSNAATYIVDSPTCGKSGFISLRSLTVRDGFWRHQGFIVKIHAQDSNVPLWREDTCFRVESALNGNSNYITLRAENYPSHVLVIRSDNRIGLVEVTNDADFNERASWEIKPGLAS